MLEIKSNGVITKLFQDGVQINGVKSVSFTHSTNGNAELNVSLVSDEVSIDAEFVPELPEFYKPFYERKKDV